MKWDPPGPGDSPLVSRMLSFQSPGTLASASPTNAVTGTYVVGRNSGTRRPAFQGAWSRSGLMSGKPGISVTIRRWTYGG
jgi:hypothetical protein